LKVGTQVRLTRPAYHICTPGYFEMKQVCFCQEATYRSMIWWFLLEAKLHYGWGRAVAKAVTGPAKVGACNSG
jgi:hypothetical protein